MDELSPEDKDQALFQALLYSLHASGMQQLGKITNPMTGKIERDLTQAQYTIDMLDMLKRRTEGNRTELENKLISRVLAELQMNYVDEVEADKKTEATSQDAEDQASAVGGDAEKGGTPSDADGKTETERSTN